MPRSPIPRIATLQDGLITRAQAIQAGMSPAAVKHAIRPGGPWQRIVTGVYATFTGPVQDEHRLRAAVLAAGPDAVITGAWACQLAGLTYGPPPDHHVDVLIADGHHRGNVGFVRVIRTPRLPQPLLYLGNDDGRQVRVPLEKIAAGDTSLPGVLPVAPPARAVIDTVVRLDRLPASWRPTCDEPRTCPGCRRGAGHAQLARRNVRALMCEVVQRRRASVPVLQAELAAAPRRGGALARAALADIVAGCRSAPECELRDLVRSSRVLPEPRWNRPLPDHPDIVPDACWPEARLVVEVDSRSFHGFGDAPERTEARRARYAALGWRVLPVSPTRLRRDPHAVRREIEAAYRAGLMADG